MVVWLFFVSSLVDTSYPDDIMQKHVQFKEIVSEVKEMGFDPLKSTFVLVVHAIQGRRNEPFWDQWL